MSRWEPDYRGLSALVIAVCAAFGIFVITPIGLAILGMRLGEIGGEVLIALGGALVGSVATYMGMKYESRHSLPKEPPPPPPDPPTPES